MEDDNESLIGIQAPKSTFERLALVRLQRLVAGDRLVEGGQFDLDGTTLVAPQLVVTGADEESVEPRIESIGIAQAWQVAPRTDQGLLHGVLGPVWVAEDESCGRIQTTDRGACKRLEGVMIAPLRPLHELSLHGGLTHLRAPFGRAVEYVVG